MGPTPCARTFSAAPISMARRPTKRELLGRPSVGLGAFLALAAVLCATPVAALGDGTTPGAGSPLCRSR
jgi:hypothetical protein